MSNTKEVLLQRRVKKLEEELEAMTFLAGTYSDFNEYAVSVACAFAMDLAVEAEDSPVLSKTISKWYECVSAVREEVNKETEE